MEKCILQNDLVVFGKQVTAFPAGISEAFDALVKMLPGGFDRSFYGISFLNKNGVMVYIASALELFDGEAENYGCENYVIEKGEYLTVTVQQWRKKTNSLNAVFHEMLNDITADRTKPAIEWYKNEEEMICMLKVTGQ